MKTRRTNLRSATLAIIALLTAAGAPEPAAAAAIPSPATSNVRYDVTFDAVTAGRREIHVEMSFDVDAAGPVALSFPAWTPGSYEMDDYARNVRNVSARLGEAGIHWDKADYDTWRVHPAGAGRVTFAFDYHAESLDVGSSWSTDDFAFFNGTNLLPFLEETPNEPGAEVFVHTEPDWAVATGLTPASGRHAYTASSYDELVDMPTFVGRFDVDSTQVEGIWYRLATYPTSALAGDARSTLWQQIQGMIPPMAAVFGEIPWQHYTTLLVFDPTFGGGSALEHANSHLGIYANVFVGSPVLPSITAHEIFHAWNVKRLRPADLWPYAYDREMPTELLWISEGITDYYADLALVRGRVAPPGLLYQITQGKIDNVASLPPVALEDASLSTWIQPTDGTASIHYDKGSLAGLLLDILIRDASDNARSLDDVMRAMYERAYLAGRGFTEDEWWEEVRAAAGGRAFDDFHDRYVDGREPYPWGEVLPLAGLVLDERTERVARIGITTTGSDAGVEVVGVAPGGAGAAAGVLEGDLLRRIGGILVEDNGFGEAFRQRFGDRPAGATYEIVVDRGGTELTLEGTLAFADVTVTELREDPAAGEKARRIRLGILRGG